MINKVTVILAFLAVCIVSVINGGKTISVFQTGETKSYVAIIIDDFGYGGEGTDEMLSLDIPFTAAIMPFSPNAQEDAKKAEASGKDIIIHMPMESVTGKKEWVGDKGVFTSLTESEIRSVTEEAIAIVGKASGLNNHMGSAIMESERCFSIVAEVLCENNMVFVDSVTTPKSVGEKICSQKGITFFERDVFLDSTDDISKIKENIIKTGDIALKKGYAVAIGHVGPEGGKVTAQALKETAAELKNKGIEFVTITRLREIYGDTGNTL